MKSEVGIKNLDDNFLRKHAKQENQHPVPDPKHFQMKFDTRMLKSIYEFQGENMNSEAWFADESGCTTHQKMDTMNLATSREFTSSETGGFPVTKLEPGCNEVG